MDGNNNVAGWKQKEFTIGAFQGVRMTGGHEEDMAILKTFSAAGFNLLVIQHYWYSSGLFDQSGTSFNPEAVSVKYMLEALADYNKDAGENKLGLLAHDNEICGRAIPLNMPYSAERFSNYLRLSPYLRESLYGYNLMDEPDAERLRECLPAIRSAKDIDKEKLAFVNLGDGGYSDVTVFFQNEDKFRLHVRDLAEEGSIISFDNYHWITRNELPMNTVSGKFFKMAEIVSEEAKKANIPWWGFALCVEHVKRKEDGSVRWGFRLHDPDNRNPKTELARIRFSAYANIIYGAKGVTWFMYDTHNCPVSNPENLVNYIDSCSYSYHDACLDYYGNMTIFYDYVKEVNKKMKNMGPVLMELTWLTTVHGSSDNNYVNVPKGTLPVVQGDTPVIGSMPNDNTLAVGIFEGKDKNKYIAVLNKDVEHDKSYKINLKDTQKVYYFNCNSRKWGLKGFADPGIIIVNVEAGDIEIFKIIAK